MYDNRDIKGYRDTRDMRDSRDFRNPTTPLRNNTLLQSSRPISENTILSRAPHSLSTPPTSISSSSRSSGLNRSLASMNQTSQHTTSTPSQQVSSDHIDEIREAFRLFDTTDSGFLDLRELKAAMRALGYDVRREEARQLLSSVGKQHATHVTLLDFEQMMIPKLASRNSKEEIYKIFRLFDPEDTGYITFKMLKIACQELGEGFSDDDIMEMITEADMDQDGKISFPEFHRIMKKRSQTNTVDEWDSDDE